MVGGIGVYGLNENGEGLDFHLKVPMGIGVNIKLYKRLFLRLNTTYNREIYRNRGYYIYDLGLSVKLGENPTRKKKDLILEPILIGAVDSQPFPDADQDGVPDSLDQCPLVAGIQANAGCPLLVVESEGPKADAITMSKNQEVTSDSILQGVVSIEDHKVPTSDDGVEPMDSIKGDRDILHSEQPSRDKKLVQVEKSDILNVPTVDNDVIQLIRDTVFIHDTIQAIKYITINDRDGDGIEDDIDQCPDEMGVLKYHGCKKPKNAVPLHENKEWNQVDNSVNNKELNYNDHNQSEYDFTTLKFPTGIAALQYAHIPELQKIISELKRYSNYHLNIYGYTNNEGTEKLNRKLSNRRALACYQYLKLFNVPAENMSYQGMGEMHPIDDNATYSGRGNNRRVVFKLEHNPGN